MDAAPRGPERAPEGPDPRTAIADRREELRAEPRPQVLGPDVRERMEADREAQDTIRVYRYEWVTMFSSTTPYQLESELAAQECNTHFNAKYQGRVRDEDWRVGYSAPGLPARLQLRLPNVKGEFKTRARAEAYVAARGWKDAKIVQCSSVQEQKLKDYGVKRLPKEV